VTEVSTKSLEISTAPDAKPQREKAEGALQFQQRKLTRAPMLSV